MIILGFPENSLDIRLPLSRKESSHPGIHYRLSLLEKTVDTKRPTLLFTGSALAPPRTDRTNHLVSPIDFTMQCLARRSESEAFSLRTYVAMPLLIIPEIVNRK